MTTAPKLQSSLLLSRLLGFPGLGWIFSGRVFTGLKILLIYWGAIFAFGFGISMTMILTLGFASLLFFVLAPLTVIVYFAVPLVSAGKLYQQMRQVNTSRQSSQITAEPPQARVAPSIERYMQSRKPAQTQGLASWQLAIIIGLTIVATLIFGGLAVLLFGTMSGA
jgi:hypothetical protein